MGWLSSAVSTLFGSSSNGKGLVSEVSDAVDRWNPSATSLHEMALEDQNAGDASQDSARQMVIKSHDSWFDIFVDGINRLVRPTITVWVVGGLIGWWDLPSTGDIDPVILNIIWTVITFWFGSRVVFKDIPAAMMLYKGFKNE